MSETKIKDLRINKGLTKQQLIDSTVITENELSFVTDDSVVDVPAPTEVGKVLTSTEDGVEWAEGSSGLPDQTGQSGKFLSTNGTNANWETINALQNTATNQSTNLIVDGTSTPYSPAGNYNVVFGKEFQFSRGIIFGSKISHDGSTPIGYGNIVLGTFKTLRDNTSECVVIGSNGSVYGMGTIAIGTYAGTVTNHKCDYSIAIGNKAYCDGSYGCIQIGAGTNTETQTLKVGFASNYGSAQYEYKLLDSDGTIPEARLADTTNAAQGMVLTLDANLNAVWQAGGSGGGISDVTVNGVSVVSGSVATITCATIDDTSTTSTTATWSASKLNATIGDIETLINAL